MSPTPWTPVYHQPSRTHYVRAENSSETASLQGKPAKTPIIAGSVCGGVLLLAWIIGFSIYFRKRYIRKKLKRAAAAIGMPPPELKSRPETEKVVIPPDPAVLLGQRQPGYAFAEANGAQAHIPQPVVMYTERPTSDLTTGGMGTGCTTARGGMGKSSSEFAASGKHVEEKRPPLTVMTNFPDMSAACQRPRDGDKGRGVDVSNPAIG